MTRRVSLAQGFKQSTEDPDIFFPEYVRLGDVAEKLGVAIECTPDWRDQKPHLVVVGDRCFYVVGEMPPADHGKVKKADIICTVSTDLGSKGLYKPAKPLLPTDGTPHLRIKSVTVPKNRKEPLQVTFDLSTDGKTPLALSRRQLAVRLFSAKRCVFATDGEFADKLPSVIVVQPGKATTLTMIVSESTPVPGQFNERAPGESCDDLPSDSDLFHGVSGDQLADRRWSNLPPAKYVLRVAAKGAGHMKPLGPPPDYEWRGVAPAPAEKYSDDYTITIKGKEGR